MSQNNWRVHFCVLAIFSLGAASVFAAAPTISAFAPASGVLYSTVTITGTNFVAPVTVSFNGVASTTVTVVSSTSVKAAVPPTASTGAVAVAASGGSANSASAFTVLPGLLVSPAVGPPTTVTRIYYSGFGPQEALDLYFDTGDVAISSASAAGAANLPVTIPAAGRPGVHFVTAVGRHTGYSAQATFTVQTSWPQFGFTPTHKGRNRYENVLSPATVADLDEAWRTPGVGKIESTPAIVNGIVYATLGDGSIRAFDEITGAQKWAYTTGAPGMYSSPAVANGIVYAGSSDRSLYALDAVTGALKWRCLTGSYVYSSPTVVNGIVYFGSYDSNVYALNATTGAFVWSYLTGGPVFSSPLVVNGLVVVGSSDGYMYGFTATNGQKYWQAGTGGDVFSSPVLAAGLICFGSDDGYLYAVHTDGELAWTFKTGGVIEGAAAAAGNEIFFCSADAIVYALSANGALRWEAAFPEPGSVHSTVCVANGVVYAADGSNTYAFDQNSGVTLAALPAGSDYSGLAVVNGALFASSLFDYSLIRYTPNALLSNFVAPRPDPMQLRAHRLR